MTIKRILLLCLGITIVAAVLFLLWKLREPTPAELLQAEQEIYALLLEEQKYAYSDLPDAIQVVELTNSDEFQPGVPSSGLGLFRESLELKYFSSLEEGTLLDYQAKNAKPYPIKNYLSDSANIILVNPADGKQLNWWVSFSRIGFNSSMTQALVLEGDCRGEACYDNASVYIYSMGEYIVLNRIGGKWIIKERQSAWIVESPAP
ncbi:MAG TPA: hypothetical protein PKK96_13775 [Anaerolineales bacterium]|nr:hypothetical protein [Anaerolineales bacterium]HMR99916.1 hypothetical protein [Anaerolineales bacterium]HNQ95443.1 hypothetical protein [Anaerolineales bacterium]HNS62069.1 hypothetical protein [Anaerolineales bacterium]